MNTIGAMGHYIRNRKMHILYEHYWNMGHRGAWGMHKPYE